MMRDSWDTIITTAEATATIWKITPKFTVAALPERDTQKSSLMNLTVTISVFKILNYLSRLIFLAIVDTALLHCMAQLKSRFEGQRLLAV